ncbi:hypothetical protein R6Q59_030584 [Mikania micrantha]
MWWVSFYSFSASNRVWVFRFCGIFYHVSFLVLFFYFLNHFLWPSVLCFYFYVGFFVLILYLKLSCKSESRMKPFKTGRSKLRLTGQFYQNKYQFCLGQVSTKTSWLQAFGLLGSVILIWCVIEVLSNF